MHYKYLCLPSRHYKLISYPNLNRGEISYQPIHCNHYRTHVGRLSQLSGASPSLFHCVSITPSITSIFTVCPTSYPLPLAITLNSHPHLLPLTPLSILLCDLCTLSITHLSPPSYCVSSNSGIPIHCFVLLCIHQLKHPPPPSP